MEDDDELQVHEIHEEVQLRRRRRYSRISIGTVEMLGEDGKNGIILPLDGSTEATFDVGKDVDPGVDVSQLQGAMVQFVREMSETGLRATRITVLNEGKAPEVGEP